MPSDTDIHVDHQQSDYSSDEDLIQPVQETEGSEYLNLGAHAIFGVHERSSTYAPESDWDQYSDGDRTEGGNLILPIQEMEGRLRGVFSEDVNAILSSQRHNITHTQHTDMNASALAVPDHDNIANSEFMNTAVDVVGRAGNQGHELSIMSKVLFTILIIMCYPLLWSGAFNCSSRNNHNFTYLMLVMLVLCFCSETSIISSILDLFIPLIKYISPSEWSACFS